MMELIEIDEPKVRKRKRYARPEKKRYDRSLIEKIICKIKPVGKYEFCGSYRRGKEMIGDIDLLALENQDHLKSLGEVICDTDKKLRIIIDGIQLDIFYTTPESWCFALIYFTGSQKENIRVRWEAKKQGMKLNEYGLFRGEKRIECKTEQDIYNALGLNYVNPEDR